MVTKRERQGMPEQKSELVLNQISKKQKVKVELREAKEKLIDNILYNYLDDNEDINDIYSSKMPEEIGIKINSIKNITEIKVIKLLLKSNI